MSTGARAFDVLVLGGGPAGATFAALAAGAGARVLVAERKRFPRDKVCGEFVSAEGCRVLARLGVLELLAARGAGRIGRVGLTDARGRRVESALPELPGLGREALGVSRALLDTVLLESAVVRGAEVCERCEAVAPLTEDGRVTGARLRRVGDGSDGEPVTAKVVVAADGRRSLLLRTFHPGEGDPARTRDGSWFGLKTHLALDDSRLDGRVELHQFDGGYAGMSRVEEGRLNVCLMVRAGALRDSGGTPDRVLRERVQANPRARERVADLSRCGRWTSVGPLAFNVRRPVSHGALFVGDAAGTIEPFCGEGISNALRGAELALPWALRAIEHGRLTADLATGYRRAWLGAFGPVTRRVRPIGYVLERPALARPMFGLLGGVAAALLPRIVAATRTGA